MDDRLYPLPGASAVPPEVIARLKAAVGPRGFAEDPAEIAPHVVAWRDGWQGEVPLVMRPETTQEVAAIVRICAEAEVAIVPQSGNTGLTGGGQPHMGGSEIVLSLARMNRIRAVDPLNDSMTVEAGVILQRVQEEAARHDRLFPLSLAAEGTCQIGGNLSTNAGGVQVLRYGNARALVLGLEVVTAQGEIWDGLRALRKDNAGYDMKQVFLGSEGTLGIITAATLKLMPRPKDSAVALVAVPSAEAGIQLLAHLKSAMGETVTAFELMHEICFTLARETMGHEDPLPGHEWRVLLQVDGPGPEGRMAETLQAALAEAMEAGVAVDAALPSSLDQVAKLWRIREDQAEVQQRAGAGIKHDISVPVSRIPEFVARADAARLPPLHLRARRRRQPALQPDPARGLDRRRLEGRDRRDQPHRPRSGGGDERLDHRRARGRPPADARDGAPEGPGRDVPDAPPEGRHGSRGHPQPRQDAALRPGRRRAGLRRRPGKGCAPRDASRGARPASPGPSACSPKQTWARSDGGDAGRVAAATPRARRRRSCCDPAERPQRSRGICGAQAPRGPGGLPPAEARGWRAASLSRSARAIAMARAMRVRSR